MPGAPRGCPGRVGQDGGGFGLAGGPGSSEAGRVGAASGSLAGLGGLPGHRRPAAPYTWARNFLTGSCASQASGAPLRPEPRASLTVPVFGPV